MMEMPAVAPLDSMLHEQLLDRQQRLRSAQSQNLFTDGVTEANASDGSEFGTDRLRASINGRAYGHPTELLQTCVNAVAAFRNGTARNDDLTMLALKYTGAVN